MVLAGVSPKALPEFSGNFELPLHCQGLVTLPVSSSNDSVRAEYRGAIDMRRVTGVAPFLRNLYDRVKSPRLAQLSCLHGMAIIRIFPIRNNIRRESPLVIRFSRIVT